ncbi:MAG: AtpZ/AtpI family protein [Microthrixaceae bacterium]
MTTDTPATPALTEAANRSSGSFELVLGPVLMALLGLALDGVFGTRPILTVTLTIWGALGAGVAIYYRYRHQAAQDAEDRSRARAERQAARSHTTSPDGMEP